jgi:hypothetical protein
MRRSASVDLPWSMWAMMQKLRIWSMALRSCRAGDTSVYPDMPRAVAVPAPCRGQPSNPELQRSRDGCGNTLPAMWQIACRSLALNQRSLLYLDLAYRPSPECSNGTTEQRAPIGAMPAIARCVTKEGRHEKPPIPGY